MQSTNVLLYIYIYIYRQGRKIHAMSFQYPAVLVMPLFKYHEP